MNDTTLSIYECSQIINEIETIAYLNDGEIPEEAIQELVEAQTTSIVKLKGLCGFMKHLEHGIALCEQEEERIAKMRKVAANRLESVKGYLLPYLVAKGKPVDVGTFKLSTRKSEAVAVNDEYFASWLNETQDKNYIREIPARWEVDKAAVKAALKEGKEIQGCTIEKRVSVQLK